MSVVLRAANRAVLRQNAARGVRSFHGENLRDHTIPGGSANKTAFAIRFGIFTTVGFGLPFFMWKVAEAKAAGGS